MPRVRNGSRAEQIAANLCRTHGAAALWWAHDTRSRAEGAGDHKTADLYRAVSTILHDRDAVFSNSRAPVAAPRARASHRY